MDWNCLFEITNAVGNDCQRRFWDVCGLFAKNRLNNFVKRKKCCNIGE